MEFAASIDRVILQLLVSQRSDALTAFFASITALGGVKALVIITIFSCVCFYIANQKKEALHLLFIFLGTELSVFIIKAVIQRPRPAEGITEYLEKSFSFPSGHAAASTALFGFLTCYLASRARTRFQKTCIIMCGVILVILIGFSRLYLGVHYVSDVIGGFILGGIWLAAVLTVANVRKIV